MKALATPIRQAAASDREDLARLHIASIQGLCAGHYEAEALRARTALLTPSVYDQALAEKLVLVAEQPGHGAVGLAILDPEAAEISALYVHPEAVGKGVGTALLEAMEQRAGAAGILTLTTRATLNARGFYAARGYLDVGPGHHRLPGGVRLPCVAMTKTLG
ncbi:GNAT family N-acetyltransferase [Marichromatium sp. AB32]|uniref:GNAT family N-acetyltransferase n=1 Tax=Marichromatium sp. AB32 TaxID=2483363 RepID=UPI000F3CC57D|nr:GNAT family N-acetyltransferase [Marichromatium sp. AB32]RNE93196.1 N-acetyltransferase [Marichromatium sp. AB32]